MLVVFVLSDLEPMCISSVVSVYIYMYVYVCVRSSHLFFFQDGVAAR